MKRWLDWGWTLVSLSKEFWLYPGGKGSHVDIVIGVRTRGCGRWPGESQGEREVSGSVQAKKGKRGKSHSGGGIDYPGEFLWEEKGCAWSWLQSREADGAPITKSESAPKRRWLLMTSRGPVTPARSRWAQFGLYCSRRPVGPWSTAVLSLELRRHMHSFVHLFTP